MAKAQVNIYTLGKNNTLTVIFIRYSTKVKITTQFKVRLAIAMALLKAAAFVLGCGIRIENEEVL